MSAILSGRVAASLAPELQRCTAEALAAARHSAGLDAEGALRNDESAAEAEKEAARAAEEEAKAEAREREARRHRFSQALEQADVASREARAESLASPWR